MRHRDNNTTAALAVVAAALTAIMAVVSCSKEKGLVEPAISLDRTITITAFHADGSGSKNTLENGGTDVFWQPGDEIKLFRGSNSSLLIADISENSIVASFSGPDPEGEGEFVAVYPSSLASHCADGNVNITIPCMQVAKAGSFAPETYITMGHSATTEMGFYSVCGGFRFTLSQEGIKRVAFESLGLEPIAGDAVAAFVDGRPALQNPSSTLGFSRIILDAPDGESFQTGKWYYIVAAPATLHKGFKLSFYKKDSWGVKTFTNTVEIKRGAFGSKQNVDNGVVFSDTEHEYVDLGLSVKWATCNVGATLPEEYGEHFAWGETEPKSNYEWNTYKWCTVFLYNNRIYLNKYCTKHSFGNLDDKCVLEPSDDAAYVNWGDDWRMPTYAEMMELKDPDNCSMTWTVLNGVEGLTVVSKIEGYIGNWIFLPAAGIYWGDKHSNAGSLGYYLASSVYVDEPTYVPRLTFHNNGTYFLYDYRCYGVPVRPVRGGGVAVTSVELSEEYKEVIVGDVFDLSAYVYPENATDKNIIWYSHDDSVATVDNTGRVTAVGEGGTYIVAVASNGVGESCYVEVEAPQYNYEYVDLGLSVKWATCNVGATEPEDYGDYFAWGETEPKDYYSWLTYKWCNDYGKLTKYCNDSSYWDSTEPMDNKTVLDFEDDAAHVNWGGSWRMPTDTEWTELQKECTWTWTDDYNGTGVLGWIVTSNYTDESIFLPAAGRPDLGYAGSRGFYWSSSLDTDNPNGAYTVEFDSDYMYYWDSFGRSLGFSVRPVSE